MLKEPIFKKFLNNVKTHMGVGIEELFDRSKESRIVLGRQSLFLLCKERGLSITEIKDCLERHNYTTEWSSIAYGIKKAQQMRDQDKDFETILHKLNDID